MKAVNSLDRRRLLLGGIACGATTLAPSVALARDPVTHVEQFRRPHLADREVLRAAFVAWQRHKGGTLILERGHAYDLGPIGEGPDLYPISGLQNALLEGNGATISARSRTGLSWNLLSFSNIAGLVIRDLKFMDSGYRGDAFGMKAVVLQPGVDGVSGVMLENVVAQQVLSMVQCQGPADSARVKSVVFGPNCVAHTCYYGLCCQDQGDEISGALLASNCRRPYLIYGVRGHSLGLDISHEGPAVAPTSRSPVLVKSYGRSTRDIHLAINFSSTLPWEGSTRSDRGACISVEHQSPGAPSLIENVSARVTIPSETVDLANPFLLMLASYSDGQLERATANRWRNISVQLTSTVEREVFAASNPQETIVVKLSGAARMPRGRSTTPNVSYSAG